MPDGPAATMEINVVHKEAAPVKTSLKPTETKPIFTKADLPSTEDPRQALVEIAGRDNKSQETPPTIEALEKKDEILQQRTETIKNKLKEKYQDRLDSDPKLKKSIEYLLESKDKKGTTPLNKIISVYSNLENADDNLALKQIEQISDLAIAQQQQNPEQYVSHGFDHTLNVLQHTRTIIENNPQLIDVMIQKYNINKNEAQFMMEMVALTHDFGYPDSEGKGLGKAAHAISGAETAAKLNFEGLIENRSMELLIDFRDAALFHGADKIEAYFDSKVQTTRGEFLVSKDNILTIISEFQIGGDKVEQILVNIEDQETQDKFIQILAEAGVDSSSIKLVDNKFGGRYSDFFKMNSGEHEVMKKAIGLEFHEVDLVNSPLSRAIRIADNMDMSADRFSEVQTTPAFQEIYRRLGADDIPGAVIYQELIALSNEQSGLTQDQVIDRVKQKLLKKTEMNEETVFQNIKALQDVLDTETGSTVDMTKLSNAWKAGTVNQVLSEHQGEIDPETAENIKKIGLMQNEQSYWHFGGCEAVNDIKLEGSTVGITVDGEKMTELNKSFAKENNCEINIPVGLYQVWRMTSAYASIKVADMPIDIIVQYADKDGKIKKIESYKSIPGKGFINILE